MKLYSVLFRQHIGWHFKKNWRTQGKKVASDTGIAKILADRGIPLYQPRDILDPARVDLIDEVPDYIPQPVKFDNTHPNWHDRICHTYTDNDVLVEGLKQAKIITNTVEPHNGLPFSIELKKPSSKIDNNVRSIILNSHLFDAEQVKLPKRKDPERPAWNFPRDYGVSEKRVNKLIVTKLLLAIELLADQNLVKQRLAINDLPFWYPFEKAGELFQFQLTGDCLVTSSNPLPPISSETTENLELPVMDPVKYTVSLNVENIYDLKNLYPVESFIQKSCPHTVFVHYNKTDIRNLFEEPVTEDQFLGRSLLKAYTVAASYARQKFGDVKVLPQPVTVQCIHTDGQIFHFGVIQLNTLDTSIASKIKNLWYQTPRMQLFESCGYKRGRPMLEGYNSDVFTHLNAFYNNV
ncbi:hypothetical protein PPYR_01321 [Photinus pyralis]|uniref:Large ribosomal subunit protein mL37 n=1 Tax=Photinus pyralis TaxID=7054 RepID=A0A1Y1LLQ6_PHOPY|nr:39S ribosomal protein L37, mitochondrial [Photinus pyralis]KAB0804351.1 hypothetical protein PPYR_01321 [Photinus pyralis]